MKNFLKDYGIGLVNIAIFAVSMVLMLSVAPGTMITGKGGWMVVRAIVLAWSTVMALGTYSNWTGFGQAIKQLIAEIKGAKQLASETDGSGFDWVNSYLNKIGILTWVLWWAIAFQLFASFYVADWCIGGF